MHVCTQNGNICIYVHKIEKKRLKKLFQLTNQTVDLDFLFHPVNINIFWTVVKISDLIIFETFIFVEVVDIW